MTVTILNHNTGSFTCISCALEGEDLSLPNVVALYKHIEDHWSGEESYDPILQDKIEDLLEQYYLGTFPELNNIKIEGEYL